ncbi:MAG TPA: phosphoribosylformylglycinamidine synthase [Cyclobacteriaceae bacterium]|nr:phosphoribosylformylglycinamidine synthase [Cyclobacteriaceae bacterium]HMV08607.1 phosphoribosylformylglycinamidine synthase [Cyclobacteriaceae bacterium]HMV90590.1 phosphoribosylformylglycinamidine synthase [Cyclobacteriaceae bacterium]HMX00184.1 phosphoribosylformylglycinamidine synthase [Cyclobacteriaceae bacterium]HMX49817.1 phosphoribosylformylglycinamidine synthase [Cyclobacteriaceae bacterium]
MILFFRSNSNIVYGVGTQHLLQSTDIQKLVWLLGGAQPLTGNTVAGSFIGPRKEMVSPWSTNAVEITQTMGISGIFRMEEFFEVTDGNASFDRMLQFRYNGLDQELFTIVHTPEPIIEIDDIAAYNQKEGLALSQEEVDYLNGVSKQLGRKLTDSEVFGFSQVNSEHCRHKIFNGTFVIDGKEKESTLFQLIKKTSKENPNYIVSAYKDNVAFIKGPCVEQFAPGRQDVPDWFKIEDFDSVISVKAETHNFPTTVEPFNGAATGGGGEIRDRLAGGKGSIPLSGTAVYITSYPRLDGGRPWEKKFAERKWLYQTPAEILIKASDGASDFGNKFGQPLIGGSVLTFEHFENGKKLGFDKVIMLAGGVGYGKEKDSKKEHLKAGDKIVLMGGDNYRIGMGGAAVSSVTTGEFANALELNAVQRSNPEMQKRVANAIRAMVESSENPIVSIHDHGAGGHLNCFSELLEETGGIIEIDKLPIGDTTLSDKEIISNESQERMGIAINPKHIGMLQRVSERERAPMYVVGTATGDGTFKFVDNVKKTKPVDLKISNLFGSSPKTILQDKTIPNTFEDVRYDANKFQEYLEQLLQLEAVACKDWLTNKVDRCVTGRVATQQTCGSIQLPLNNVSVMALDFISNKGIATGIGHAPGAALVNPAAGSKMAIAEALLNIIWAPLTYGLKGVSLSANWMWPTKTAGENSRLYSAVEAVSDFACKLGINVPTGKDSLSMTQKYPNGETVDSPGTVIISAVAECSDIRKTISPDLKPVEGSSLLYIAFSNDDFKLGGSSFAQIVNQLGTDAPTVTDEEYFIKAFAAVQELINTDKILSGHDVSSGGLITTLLEMCFPVPGVGVNANVSELGSDTTKVLFSENAAIVIQVKDAAAVQSVLQKTGVKSVVIGTVVNERKLSLENNSVKPLDIDALREKWFRTSYLLDKIQRPKGYAEKRRDNIFKQVLEYKFQPKFDGKLATYGLDPKRRKPAGIKAAIIREKGVNSDREMAYALYIAGFDVKDVHMTDLMTGREDLSEVNLIVFVGGFSNSDVLGSAKGWAGAFLYNPKAKAALENFYKRNDTLSLGVCNGCQLMMEMGLLYPEWKEKMHHNGSGKFECSFVNLTIPQNNSVMLKSYEGAQIGVWMAHGEGQFVLPADKSKYTVAANYTFAEYPGNPNDSNFAVAALCSKDGRHLAIMPHIERSLFPWNWPHYPANRKNDEVGPWFEAFSNARDWIKSIKG